MVKKNPHSGSDEESSSFIEPNTQSFIIKIWLDDDDKESNKIIWRGHMTHVATGQRRHFDSLLETSALMGPYLEEMGVKLPIYWRIYRWLTQ